MQLLFFIPKYSHHHSFTCKVGGRFFCFGFAFCLSVYHFMSKQSLRIKFSPFSLTSPSHFLRNIRGLASICLSSPLPVAMVTASPGTWELRDDAFCCSSWIWCTRKSWEKAKEKIMYREQLCFNAYIFFLHVCRKVFKLDFKKMNFKCIGIQGKLQSFLRQRFCLKKWEHL